MSADRLPAAVLAYRAGLTLLSPLAPLVLRSRARKGKEEVGRLRERLGRPGLARPPGPLVWAHGASIGETLSLIPLLEDLASRGSAILVTSGTRTSAEILAQRLPPGARHQYLPLDAPPFVRRFLDHWRPDLVLFAESEIWPTFVTEISRRAVPLILVNGRLSARSFARWQRLPAIAEALIGRFTLCVAQTPEDAERLASAGARRTEVSGNLKFDIPPLPADPARVEALAGRLAGRPVWLAASTHPGEEDAILRAHRVIRERHPGLLTLVVPRHPVRGQEIADLAEGLGLAAGRRSQGAAAERAEVHIVDTVGELGLFYRVAALAFLGGSLVPHGGQNPIEPARLGCPILHGPHVANFRDVYAAFDDGGGARLLPSAEALAGMVGDLLAAHAARREMARAATRVVSAFAGALPRTLRAIEPYLPPATTARPLW